mgnify:CR=1 FL=1
MPEADRITPAVLGEKTRMDKIAVSRAASALIDRGLGDMLHRELVSTDEVADLLAQEFGDIDALMNATAEELSSVNGITIHVIDPSGTVLHTYDGRDEIRDMVAAGADIVQLDEPFRVFPSN